MKFLVRPTYVHNVGPIVACGAPFGGVAGVVVEKIFCLLECSKEKGGGGCSKHKTKKNCKGYCNVCNEYCAKQR